MHLSVLVSKYHVLGAEYAESSNLKIAHGVEGMAAVDICV